MPIVSMDGRCLQSGQACLDRKRAFIIKGFICLLLEVMYSMRRAHPDELEAHEMSLLDLELHF